MLLRRKIYFSLGILLVLLGACGGYLLHASRRLHALNLQLLDDAPSVDAAEEVQLELQRIARLEGLDAAPAAPDATTATRRRMNEIARALDEVEARSHTDEERFLVLTLRADVETFDPAEPDRASLETATADADRLAEFNRRELAAATGESAAFAHEAELAAFVSIALGLLAGTLVLLTTWRTLSAPLSRMSEAVRRIDAGDMRARVALPGTDELAQFGRALDAMLDAANRREEEKAAFVAGIAHDIRTPLATISMGVENLRRSLSDPKALARTEVIERQVARLDRLLGELLEVARLAAGSEPLRAEAVALDALASDAIALFRDSSPRHEFVLRAAPCFVRADPDLLMRVLVNLLSNAVKYSPEGGAVEVEVRTDGAWNELSVRDHGIGIRPEDRGRIFGRFSRLDRSSNVPGTGLGLYLARQIVVQHGGELDFESAPDNGTRFWVRLPRTESPTTQPGGALH